MVFLKSIKLYIFFLISFTVIFIILIIWNFRTFKLADFNLNNEKNLRQKNEIKKQLSCDAYIRNKKQFYVNINGEKYPKRIPLYKEKIS